MKVNRSGSLGSASGARRKDAAAPAGDAFSPDAPAARSGVSGAGAAGEASAVSSVDALLALQEVGDLDAAREQASRRAFSLLDVLDDLKIALLEGGLPPAKLNALMSLLQSDRLSTGDPRLERALDDIETRAAVELAKYRA